MTDNICEWCWEDEIVEDGKCMDCAAHLTTEDIQALARDFVDWFNPSRSFESIECELETLFFDWEESIADNCVDYTYNGWSFWINGDGDLRGATLCVTDPIGYRYVAGYGTMLDDDIAAQLDYLVDAT